MANSGYLGGDVSMAERHRLRDKYLAPIAHRAIDQGLRRQCRCGGTRYSNGGVAGTARATDDGSQSFPSAHPVERTIEMVDLVGTCPMDFWQEWIAEGDAVGEPETGEEWGWYTMHSYRSLIKPGDRFYVVAHGRLRGWAPVIGVQGGAIVRKGGAVACTIPDSIPGFRGLRKRWWHRDVELPFPEWKTAGLITKQPRAPKPTRQLSMLSTEPQP